MKNILATIEQLKKISAEEICWSQYEKATARFEKQNDLMEKLDKLARKNKTLLGRQLRYQVADGRAIYVIDKVTATSVHVFWLDYGDQWSIRGLGQRGGNVKLAEAQSKIEFQDMFFKK